MNYKFKVKDFKLFKILPLKNNSKIISLSIILNLFLINFVFSLLFTTYHLSLTPNEWWIHHTDHYLIKTNTSKFFAIKLGKKLEKIVYAYEKVLGYAALRNEKFTVVVFKNKILFNKYLNEEYATSAKTTKYFYYNKNKELKKEVVAFYDLNEVNFFRNLYHEGAKQYLQATVKNPPSWFLEGVAELFEYRDVNKKGTTIFRENTYWMYYLRNLLKKSKLNLEKLVKLKQSEYYTNSEAENYAQSWAMLFCFISKPEKRKIIWEYLDVLDNRLSEEENLSLSYKVLQKYNIIKLENFCQNFWKEFFKKNKAGVVEW